MANLGGITLKEVITFQTQIMLGSQFGRVVAENATKDDLLIACLRMGWNDAFRHTSRNTKQALPGKAKKDWPSILAWSETQWRQNGAHPAPHDDFICGKILNTQVVLSTFLAFSQAKSTEEKVLCIQRNFEALKVLFAPFKEVDDSQQPLCFGHFQKMFNIATKLYVCLYLCRDYLEFPHNKFYPEVIDNLQHADCPIDSIILNQVSKVSHTNYTNHKWSQYGGKYPLEAYTAVQDTIANLDDVGENSNLYYDFIAWKQP